MPCLAGDALFCGYKFRSDIQSHRAVGGECCAVWSSPSSWSIRVSIISILVFVLCRMGARSGFRMPSTNTVSAPFATHVNELIDVEEEEAEHFSCNAVVLGRDIVLPEGAPNLVKTLTNRGYQCHELPMSEFIKAGGACKCLTMFLPQREAVE